MSQPSNGPISDPTGLGDLDRLLGGGLPLYASVLVAGRSGTGKTILAQQMAYTLAGAGKRVLYLTALSGPRAKVIRDVQNYHFFDPAALTDRLRYEEIGTLLQDRTSAEAVGFIVRRVTDHRADLVVIDSFRAILDLPGIARSSRVFCHDLSEQLAFARCTSVLVGEYAGADEEARPEWAVADGVILLGLAVHRSGYSRTLRVLKLRGHAADPRPCRFAIGRAGITFSRPAGHLPEPRNRRENGSPFRHDRALIDLAPTPRRNGRLESAFGQGPH